MPHCIIEHSSNISERPSWQQVFADLHELMAHTGQFKKSDIKSRAICHEEFYVGNGHPAGSFVSLRIFIMSGRTSFFRKSLSQSAFAVLKKHFEQSLQKAGFSLTVQIQEMERDSYIKN